MSKIIFPKIKDKKKVSNIITDSLPLYLDDKDTPLLILTDTAESANCHLAAWRALNPSKRSFVFPSWETLPYEHFSPHRDLVSERLSILWKILNNQVDVLIVPIATAMQKLPPVSFIGARTFFLKKKDKPDINLLRNNLIASGYTAVNSVISSGEFAVRGSLLDLFPMGSKYAFRIDFFDDEIDSIKTFNPDTQRSIEAVDEICLLPAHEFPSDENAIKVFRQRFREILDVNPSNAIVYKQVSDGLFGSGVEYYFPLFFEEACVPITAYFPKNMKVISLVDIEQNAAIFWQEVNSYFKFAYGQENYPPLSPEYLYFSNEQFQVLIKEYSHIKISNENIADKLLPNVAADRQKDRPLLALTNYQSESKNRILLFTQTLGRRETMLSFLKRQSINAVAVNSWNEFEQSDIPFALMVGDIYKGFRLPEKNISIISENDLYPSTISTNRTRRKKSPFANQDASLRDLAEIKVGDPVVHEFHGIGRYQGLVYIDTDGGGEMMMIEYADEAKLYVPVSQLHLISRYAGVAYDNVVLHRLGSTAWSKARKKAIQKAHDTAAELLNLYAQRQMQQGYAFVVEQEEYQAFANGFEYNETEDQANAINAVIEDLISEKPMDRLVCGDVGFGKTEVALRAAFVVASSGKQVALLAPTTLLVEQHTENFIQRFANFPIKVASLSRFNTGKTTQSVLSGLKDGTVDIVIGTHKLVQPDIKFKNLGLVIIDEEHRFGVRQKEKLKQLRQNVDVLTLTATPIPRTLSMALDGLRDFSLITTAPERRLAVKTFVKPYSDASVREAMLRELKRGGQVFFLHNEVDTIQNMRERLEKIMPEARIGVAHGQMSPHDLERIMRGFLQQQFNVLLCSTIIETGIDIPNANTIIINRADKFGIAQLHQLRGRVGRSHHQAYAYLLTPEYVSRDAQKRLDAISAADELGSGFMLAMEDLEIRGAGEILGEGQSGDICQVGLTLYGEMLKQAIGHLKSGKMPNIEAPLSVSTEIRLHTPALLPETYCPDVQERLMLYKRLAICSNQKEIDEIYEELIDRFGLPASNDGDNNPVQSLIESHRIRVLAKQIGIQIIDANSDEILFTFSTEHTLNPTRIIELIQTDRRYQLAGQDKLKVKIKSLNTTNKVQNIRMVLKELAS